MKKRYACGLLAVLLLATWLVPSSAQAGTKALEWTKVDKPGEDEDKNIVVSPSEVSEIAVGSDGVLYVTDSENSKVYRSLNAGVTWEDITDYLVDAGAGLPAGKVAVAPDKPGIMAVVTDGGTEVYLSTDGGIDWTTARLPSVPRSGEMALPAVRYGYASLENYGPRGRTRT